MGFLSGSKSPLNPSTSHFKRVIKSGVIEYVASMSRKQGGSKFQRTRPADKMRRKWERGDVRRRDFIRQSRRRKSVWLKSQVLYFFIFFWRSSEISAKKLMFPVSVFLQTWIQDYEISVFCYFTFQKPTKQLSISFSWKTKTETFTIYWFITIISLISLVLFIENRLFINCTIVLCFALGFKFHFVKICHLNMFWPQGQIDEFVYSRW